MTAADLRDAPARAADAAPLAVLRTGRGAPIVCLHAIGHDAGDFADLARRLADRFEFILVDWPGHGNSEPDGGAVTAARYAELLQQTLVAQRVSNPVIVGNSVGGGAALLYAGGNPVRGLVLCNSAGLVDVTPVVSRICRLFERFFAAGERRAFWFNWLYARYYRLVLPMPAVADRRRAIVAQGETLAPLLRQAWAGFGRHEADLRAVAAGLDVPIWVAWAARDKVIPLRACLPAIKQLKNYRLSRYDAGHAAFLEQPERFADDFLQWLTELSAEKIMPRTKDA